jgi:hypothetical protein
MMAFTVLVIRSEKPIKVIPVKAHSIQIKTTYWYVDQRAEQRP